MSATAVLQEPYAGGWPLAPGYTVLEHLSRQEALDVYEVWSEERACRCVAKVLRPDRRGQERPTLRLRNEGQLLLGLAHPHLVRAYELLDEPELTLILEALTGATLSYLIDLAPPRLPALDIAVLGTQLCSAVRYLHMHGIVHLDVKPSNVVSDGGIAKLLDFSLARPPGPPARGVGTRAYMAPEQAGGDPITPAADVWGIGATLFEAATGVTPFQRPQVAGEEDESTAAAPLEERYPQLGATAPSVRRLRRLPRDIADAIDACLAREPERRPTPDELAEMLGGYA